MRLSYQCPDCERSMTRTDYNFSMELHREGRCQRCQWEHDQREYHCVYVTAA
jgi:DNA-directed RNA polymerase subunit RPC12/RpoP